MTKDSCKHKLPRIIDFQKIGNQEVGYLSVASVENELPFMVKRSFLTYDTPPHVSRGRHAHYQTEMVLICVQGTITVDLEDGNGYLYTFKLDNPNQGLFIPRLCWHTMHYDPGSIQLVLCSTTYAEEDYIRDYRQFRKIILTNREK